MEEKQTDIFAERADDSFNTIIAKNISQITDLAVSKGLEQARVSFEAFKRDIQNQANTLLEKIPVLHVKINEQQEFKLSSKAAHCLPRLIVNARLGLYTMLVGPAGCGKTTAAHQLAEALGLQFGSVCLTAGASESWLFGRQTPTGFIEGAFSKIYREGGVFLADEMDAADANLLLSINTALSHDLMLNPMNGETIKKHKDFVFVGAANTNGKGSTHLYTGRSRLDAATLDRMVILKVDYDSELEKQLCPNDGLYNLLCTIRAELVRQKYDEFISTRAFANSYKQREAGVAMGDIIGSLIANWGEAANKVAKDKLADFERKLPKKKGANEERVAFYQAFVAGTSRDKVWRPVEWTP